MGRRLWSFWGGAPVTLSLSHTSAHTNNLTKQNQKGLDNYTIDFTTDPFNPKGFTHLIKGHACYTPGKDLVLPSFKAPHAWSASPFLGAAPLERCVF